MSGRSGSTCAKLLQRIDLDFDDHLGIGSSAREFRRPLAAAKNAFALRTASAGENRPPPCDFAAKGQMVVLDQDRVKEAGAVIVAAAAVDGIFFQPPPAGRRFSRVVNAGFGAGDCVDVLPRQRGDAR